ncbi:MAG TPA: iron transporter [Xanthobacteraceae bacterium]|nr:iron transporter [Xanthobacteraceae bacterium]
MATAKSLLILVAAALALSAPAFAKEFYVGEPVMKNDLQIVPHYLLGIEMSPMPKGMDHEAGAVHLEVDVHGTKDEKHGFKEDEWIPYLTITYTIEKIGTGFKKTGELAAMTAGDGPHYANNVMLAGDGDYKLTYRFEPPAKAGFARHVDKETGVPDWWQPFTAEWTFHFPSKEAKEAK